MGEYHDIYQSITRIRDVWNLFRKSYFTGHHAIDPCDLCSYRISQSLHPLQAHSLLRVCCDSIAFRIAIGSLSYGNIFQGTRVSIHSLLGPNDVSMAWWASNLTWLSIVSWTEKQKLG